RSTDVMTRRGSQNRLGASESEAVAAHIGLTRLSLRRPHVLGTAVPDATSTHSLSESALIFPTIIGRVRIWPIQAACPFPHASQDVVQAEGIPVRRIADALQA